MEEFDFEEYDEAEGQALLDLMQEPPGGHNHGRARQSRSAGSDNGHDHPRELSTDGWILQDFLANGRGWQITFPGHFGTHGNTATLAPGEYVDVDILKVEIEKRVGFTYDEVGRLYSAKKLKADDRVRRDEIDAQLLYMKDMGTSLYPLARSMGMNERTLERAIHRAKGQRDAA